MSDPKQLTASGRLPVEADPTILSTEYEMMMELLRRLLEMFVMAGLLNQAGPHIEALMELLHREAKSGTDKYGSAP